MSAFLVTLIATVLAFVLGAVYYTVLDGQLAAARAATDPAARPPATSRWTFAAELGRCLVLAAVVVGLSGWASVDSSSEGLLLGLVLWIGFPAVLWVGAVVHERTPWRLAVIHAGDWLVKLLVLGALVGAVG